MSEDRSTVTDDVADGVTDGVADEEPKKRVRGRKLLTVVLPAVLVVGTVGGGLTYTGVTVSSADRSAPTIVWEEPTSQGEDPAKTAVTRGRATTELSRLLLPVPDGYRLGPDMDEYGNDSELSEAQAVAQLKAEGKGLAGKKRREFEKRVEKIGLKGVAARSFVGMDESLVVTVTVARMKDKKLIRDMYELRTELAELLELPKGPKVAGHKNSACFLAPKSKEKNKEEEKEELDGMFCVAYDAENLVTVSAMGGKPLDRSEVAGLVKKQLDHITSPGEYV